MAGQEIVEYVDQGAISPGVFQQGISDAQEKAALLADIVERRQLYRKIGNGKHLHVEAWQTIAMGYALTPAVQSTEILYDPEGRQIGVKAKAVVYDHNGVIRGGAEAYCMRDEANWKSKPLHQVISMAGTRAVSKALRLLLAWVVVLAGYDPTPSDELDQPNEFQQPPQRRQQRQPQRPASEPSRGPSTASYEALKSLNQLREAHSVSVEVMAGYARECYSRDVRQLTDDQLEDLKEALRQGIIAPDMKPEREEVAGDG